MRHDVVELARDPGPLFGNRQSCPLLALAFELVGALAQLGGKDVARTHNPPRNPEAGEDDGYEDQIVARVVRPDVDADDQR